jgi:hypothetical protein
VLGWSINRVVARVKILQLPERAQQMVGAAEIPLSAVDQLLSIGRVASALLDAVIAYLDDGNQWAAERLASEPGWVLDSAMREGGAKTFASYMDSVSAQEISELRLGKTAEEQLTEAEDLHKKVTPYAYRPPPIRFTEEDIDQARAAGVLIEFERGRPIIVDRPLYRELAKVALKRTVENLRGRAVEFEEEKKRARRNVAGAPENPAADAERQRDRQLRDLADQAHGVSLDLGFDLLNGLSSVDPLDMNVARFFCYSLLGPDYDGSWTKAGERVHHLAVAGIRLVVDELRSDVTGTRKDGTRGRLKIDYGDPKQPEAAIKWLWRYIDAASTPGELYGRAVVVVAAEQYAARMVLPSSQRTYRMHWGSHRDIAAKALKKLVAPHLPASLRTLERAVERVHPNTGRRSTRSAPRRPVVSSPTSRWSLSRVRSSGSNRTTSPMGHPRPACGGSRGRLTGAGAGGRGQFRTPSRRAALAATGPAPSGAKTRRRVSCPQESQAAIRCSPSARRPGTVWALCWTSRRQRLPKRSRSRGSDGV